MAQNSSPDNPLAGATLSHIMAASLPTDSPTIKNAYEAIALACHAALISVGFRLVGLGEDHRIDASSDASSDASDPQPLPSAWNAQTGSYAFRYKHSQSSMEFVVRSTRMGNKMVIMGMGLGDDKTISFDVKTSDYVSESNLPVEGEGLSYDERARKIWDAFITVGRLSDLGSLMRLQLIQKLTPSLQKAGYQEQERERERVPGREDDRPRNDPLRDENPAARPFPLQDPLAQPRVPRGPMPEPMPGFEDEHEIMRPPRGMPRGGLPGYGERDLYPQGLGPHDPIRGGVGPGLGGPMGGGGMHPTFDDPLFAGQGQGGYGYDPMAPPGARRDPPFGPGGGAHPRGAGMGGRPPNPFGGFGDGDFI